ncbi:MAG: hypothetical protein AABW75_04585 [Nanoarchaeota archaeon]
MLSEFLKDLKVVERILTLEELEYLVLKNEPINMMMGQTFDSGQPVDMLKYALIMKELGSALVSKGIEVSTKWLVADHFLYSINRDVERSNAESQAISRIEYLREIDQIYSGCSEIVKSSDLSRTETYIEILNRLKEEMKKNSNFKDKMILAVPEDRRHSLEALNYPLEELATIESLRTTIKFGPKYEIHYDEPARESAQTIGLNKFVAIHLTNSYPFGNPNLTENLVQTIEEYGILPYKITSKGLQQYRIDPTKDSDEQVKKLIMQTTDNRALADLINTGNLAAKRLTGQFPAERMTDDLPENRRIALHLYERFISCPFKKSRAA